MGPVYNGDRAVGGIRTGGGWWRHDRVDGEHSCEGVRGKCRQGNRALLSRSIWGGLYCWALNQVCPVGGRGEFCSVGKFYDVRTRHGPAQEPSLEHWSWEL